MLNGESSPKTGILKRLGIRQRRQRGLRRLVIINLHLYRIPTIQSQWRVTSVFEELPTFKKPRKSIKNLNCMERNLIY